MAPVPAKTKINVPISSAQYFFTRSIFLIDSINFEEPDKAFLLLYLQKPKSLQHHLVADLLHYTLQMKNEYEQQ